MADAWGSGNPGGAPGAAVYASDDQARIARQSQQRGQEVAMRKAAIDAELSQYSTSLSQAVQAEEQAFATWRANLMDQVALQEQETNRMSAQVNRPNTAGWIPSATGVGGPPQGYPQGAFSPPSGYYGAYAAGGQVPAYDDGGVAGTGGLPPAGARFYVRGQGNGFVIVEAATGRIVSMVYGDWNSAVDATNRLNAGGGQSSLNDNSGSMGGPAIPAAGTTGPMTTMPASPPPVPGSGARPAAVAAPVASAPAPVAASAPAAPAPVTTSVGVGVSRPAQPAPAPPAVTTSVGVGVSRPKPAVPSPVPQNDLPGGSVQLPDGRWQLPDGVIVPAGTMIARKPDGSPLDPVPQQGAGTAAQSAPTLPDSPPPIPARAGVDGFSDEMKAAIAAREKAQKDDEERRKREDYTGEAMRSGRERAGSDWRAMRSGGKVGACSHGGKAASCPQCAAMAKGGKAKGPPPVPGKRKGPPPVPHGANAVVGDGKQRGGPQQELIIDPEAIKAGKVKMAEGSRFAALKGGSMVVPVDENPKLEQLNRRVFPQQEGVPAKKVKGGFAARPPKVPSRARRG